MLIPVQFVFVGLSVCNFPPATQASVLLSGPSSMALALLALTLGTQHRAAHEQQQQQEQQQEQHEQLHQKQSEAVRGNYPQVPQPSQPFGGSGTAHGVLTSPQQRAYARSDADSSDITSFSSNISSTSYYDHSVRACACGGGAPTGSGEVEHRGSVQGKERSASAAAPLLLPLLPPLPPLQPLLPRFQLLCGPAVGAVAWALQVGVAAEGNAVSRCCQQSGYTACHYTCCIITAALPAMRAAAWRCLTGMHVTKM